VLLTLKPVSFHRLAGVNDCFIDCFIDWTARPRLVRV
jgi:hypothetical protein